MQAPLIMKAPNHPDSGRFWQVIDKHQVTLFYTAPTMIRALMREGEAQKSQRSSLRLLGTVGKTDQSGSREWHWRVVDIGAARIVGHLVSGPKTASLITLLPGAIDQSTGAFR